MQHLMFDIDGTLLQSQPFDTDLFSLAVFEETGIEVDTNGSKYTHVSDAGLLREILATAKYEKQHAQVAAAVKKNFYNKIDQHLQASPVMEIASARAIDNDDLACTYFGDGEWDKKACAQMNYNFVLVGDLLEHTPQIENFMATETILELLEL